MSQELDLKQIEAKAWRSVFQDGLWDIYLGLLLLLMGGGDLLDRLNLPDSGRIAIYIGLQILAMLVLWTGKRFITLPRMGRVKFGPERKARQHKVVLILFGSVILGMVMWLIASAVSNGWAAGLPWMALFPAIYALNVLAVFGLAAYLFQFERLYLIAVLFALPVPVDALVRAWLGIRLGFWAFAVPALIILAMGVILLMRFLRDYSVPVEDDNERG